MYSPQPNEFDCATQRDMKIGTGTTWPCGQNGSQSPPTAILICLQGSNSVGIAQPTDAFYWFYGREFASLFSVVLRVWIRRFRGNDPSSLALRRGRQWGRALMLLGQRSVRLRAFGPSLRMTILGGGNDRDYLAVAQRLLEFYIASDTQGQAGL